MNCPLWCWHSWDSSHSKICVHIFYTCRLMKLCSTLQYLPWTSSLQRHLTLMGTNYKEEYISVFSGVSLQINLPRVTAPRMLEIFEGIDPMPFPLLVPCSTHWTSQKLAGGLRERERERGMTEIGCVRYKRKNEFIWGEDCQKPWEHAPEVRTQLQGKGIFSSQLSEWASATHFTYLKPPFYPLYCYLSHFYADCPQGIIHIWIFKYFTSILSSQCLNDVSCTELNQQAM